MWQLWGRAGGRAAMALSRLGCWLPPGRTGQKGARPRSEPPRTNSWCGERLARTAAARRVSLDSRGAPTTRRRPARGARALRSNLVACARARRVEGFVHGRARPSSSSARRDYDTGRAPCLSSTALSLFSPPFYPPLLLLVLSPLPYVPSLPAPLPSGSPFFLNSLPHSLRLDSARRFSRSSLSLSLSFHFAPFSFIRRSSSSLSVCP